MGYYLKVMPSGAFFSNRNLSRQYGGNIMKITQFLRETKGEMKQVTWPSRRHLFLYTAVVIIFSLILGYMLGAFDTILHAGLRSLVN
jgi:preprotein translocase SecE subunit